jgi:hypothetical protein
LGPYVVQIGDFHAERNRNIICLQSIDPDDIVPLAQLPQVQGAISAMLTGVSLLAIASAILAYKRPSIFALFAAAALTPGRQG